MTAMDALMPNHGTFIRSLANPPAPVPKVADGQVADGQPIHVAKYIVIQRLDGEFPILFPVAMQHSHMVPRDAIVISAGFYQIIDADTLIVNGESTSLNLKPRPEDAALIHALLNRESSN